MQKTVLQLFFEYMSSQQYFIGNDLLEKYDELMFTGRGQIIDAFKNGEKKGESNCEFNGESLLPNAEKYYAETFI